jgi:hypothetical protein
MHPSTPACRPVLPRCCLAGNVDVVLGDDREAMGAYLQERARQERRWEEEQQQQQQ